MAQIKGRLMPRSFPHAAPMRLSSLILYNAIQAVSAQQAQNPYGERLYDSRFIGYARR